MHRTPEAQQALADIAALRECIAVHRPSAVVLGEFASHALALPNVKLSELSRASGHDIRTITEVTRAYEQGGFLTTVADRKDSKGGPPPRRIHPHEKLAQFMLNYNYLFGGELALAIGGDVSSEQLVTQGLRCMTEIRDITLPPAVSLEDYSGESDSVTSIHPQVLAHRGLGMLATGYGVERRIHNAINMAARLFKL